MNDKHVSHWQAKLAALLHDPAEKALVLMRTGTSHEAGTVAQLRAELGLEPLPQAIASAVRRADHWASAADRAAFPRHDTDGRYPSWQVVRFAERPVIIHPLTGAEFDLRTLADVEPEDASRKSLEHYRRLIAPGDHKKTALSFWRFGPELEDDQLGALWSLLPADTRVPDHSIFDHLDFAAALATAMAADPDEQPALLAVSIGPVQDFIAASRSSTDLWAGSHLLARIAWEAMRVICEELGPDAVLFPRLRGVPLVDLWLREEMQLDPALFASLEWTRSASDANPLFAAALPNRFTALVPARQAAALGERITKQVRDWAKERARDAYRRLLHVAGEQDRAELPGYAQIERQLADFPEVHWAAVPWSLVETDTDGRVMASSERLANAMQPFFESTPPGYLGSQSWRLVSGGVPLEQGEFWRPNPGSLYPALHELLEAVLAATKSVRPFAACDQYGWRDSLTGEHEWLTTDVTQLSLPPGQRQDTLWAKVAAARPAWAKRGEHLSALGALKRLWPDIFADELARALGAQQVNRFVVSTHTMALANSMARALDSNQPLPDALSQAISDAGQRRIALPRKLAQRLHDRPDRATLFRLPAWLEAVRETDDDQEKRRADRLLEDWLGTKPEAYYGMLLLDGDHMGAWVAADPARTLSYQDSFHPQIRAALQRFADDAGFVTYAAERRGATPSRHMAISDALAGFALRLVPEVIERQYHGRLIYAGGDDVLAMLPVSDLLPAMVALRAAFSGVSSASLGWRDEGTPAFERQANGFIRHRGRLLRVMGERATASCGAVVAHHQAPLSAVLRELRAAEQRAKLTRRFADRAGRNAFSLSIIKRSGGAICLTASWGEAISCFDRMMAFLRDPGVSRRAVYNCSLWLKDLPEPDGRLEDSASTAALAAALLAHQFKRQSDGAGSGDERSLDELAQQLVRLAMDHAPAGERLAWIENFLSAAEFLAREVRGSVLEEAGKEAAA